MKRLVVVFLTLLSCAGLLSGCLAVHYNSDSGFDVRAGTDNLKKTQRIEISDAATGKLLKVFDNDTDIKEFLGKLDEDHWHIKELSEMPPETDRECAVALIQTETVKAGRKPEDAQMAQVCTMYTYRGSGCLTMEFPFASFTFTLGDGAADYLHGFAA